MATLVAHDAGAYRWRLDPGFARLLGPQGVRLQEWLRAGQAQVVKQGPHRIVYRVDLNGSSFYLKHNLIPDRKTWARQLIRPSKAWREYKRACKLAERGIPTAEPLAWGQDAHLWGKGDSLLVTRGLDDTQPLHEYLEEVLPNLSRVEHARIRQRLAAALGGFIARLHEAGIRHNDLHAGNLLIRFAVSEKGSDPLRGLTPFRTHSDDNEIELFLIDLTAVHIGPPLAWQKVKANLAVLNRWFMPRASRADRLRFWRSYLQARGLMPVTARWPRDEDSKRRGRELERATWASLLELWRQRDRRCVLKNRYYMPLRAPGLVGHAVAGFDSRLLDTLLADPEAPLRFRSAAPLKQSGSTAVVEFDAEVNGQPVRLVYKRFPIKKWTQPLASLFRETGALRSWRLGHGFCERGLPTARPLVMLERRRHGMAGEAYLLMEKLDETLPVHEFLQSLSILPPAQRRRILDERIRLVARGVREMHRRQLCHRDLKANNILLAAVGAWRAGACPDKPWATPTFLDDLLPGMWFIDLVGVTLHRKLSQRRKVQNLARLNASFHASPNLSRTDRLRFLRGYLVCGLVGSQGWKTWWRRIAAATQTKVMRNLRRGRSLA